MTKSSSKKIKERNRKIFYACIVTLPLLQFFIFYICVNFNSILLAFKNYSVSAGESFAGFSNFGKVFSSVLHDVQFSAMVKNSLLVWLAGLLLGTTLALFFSFYIYKKYFGSGLFRVVLFLPSIVSSIVLVVIFRYFLVYALPTYFEPLGIKIPDLLDNPDTIWGTVLFYSLWTGFGSSTMMYVGAMNNISDSIVEYAKIDGFSPMQEFIYITLPLIYPTIVTFITVGIAGIFSNQMGLYQFFGREADPKVWTVGYYMYVSIQRAGLSEYPFLSAFGLVTTFVIAPITLIVKKLLEKYGPGVN